MSRPLKVFITYSHKNKKQLDTLKTNLAVLKQRNRLITWDDNEILPGDEWRKNIAENLAGSDILFYLASADSLASPNCNKELGEALSSEKNAKTKVIPIILEACDWKHHPLEAFEVLPEKGKKPLNEWNPRSKGWQNVVDGVWRIIDETQSQTEPASGTSQDRRRRAELAFQLGNFLLMVGQLDVAVKAYSESIDCYPRTTAYNNLGMAYLAKGCFDEAIKNFDDAIGLDRNYAVAYNNYGVAYGLKEDFDAAIEKLKKAIGLDRNYADAYYNLGNAYANKNMRDKAIKKYARAIKINPDYIGAYLNRGTLYAQKGDHDAAIKDFDEVIRIDPNHADAHNNRGIVYGKKGKFDDAIRDFDEAIRIDPNHVNARRNRDRAYRKMNEHESQTNPRNSGESP